MSLRGKGAKDSPLSLPFFKRLAKFMELVIPKCHNVAL